MERGTWLQQKRQEKGMTLVELEAISGISNGTISRVENNIGSTTLFTFVAICVGLGITLDEFWETFLGHLKSPFVVKNMEESSMIPIRQQDAIHFATLASQDLRASAQCLTNIFNSIQYILAGKSTKHFSLTPTNLLEWLEGRNKLYSFDISYPDLTYQRIQSVTRHEGIVTTTEVGLYIRGIRKAEALTRIELEDRIAKNIETSDRPNRKPVSDTLLGKLERSAVERFKLDDIILLAENIPGKDGSMIFYLAWIASEFEIKLNKTGYNAAVVNATYMLVILFRWIFVVGVPPEGKEELWNLRKYLTEVLNGNHEYDYRHANPYNWGSIYE